MNRKRVALIILLLGAVTVFLYMSRFAPKDQTVHFMLGDAAPRVVELDARYLREGSGTDEPARVVSYHWSKGSAPRVVTHEARLPDGDYTVEIDVSSSDAMSTVRRRVELKGRVI